MWLAKFATGMAVTEFADRAAAKSNLGTRPATEPDHQTGGSRTRARGLRPSAVPVVQRCACDADGDRHHEPVAGAAQPSLTVGRVDDPLEREADRVAGQVMLRAGSAPSISPTTPLVGRKCAECEEEEKTLRDRLPSVPDWVWVTIGAAAAALIIACFATGACEAAAIVAAVGEAGEAIAALVIAGLRLAGVFGGASAGQLSPV